MLALRVGGVQEWEGPQQPPRGRRRENKLLAARKLRNRILVAIKVAWRDDWSAPEPQKAISPTRPTGKKELWSWCVKRSSRSRPRRIGFIHHGFCLCDACELKNGGRNLAEAGFSTNFLREE